MKDKLLIVSWGLLPRAGGSSIIVENLGKNFSQKDLVILGGKGFRHKPHQRSLNFPKVIYHFTEININGRGDRFFTWVRKTRFNSLVKKIEKTIRSEKISYVLGIFPDDFYCYAACIAAKNMGIPFSSYFHNTYVENTAITDPKKHDIQEEIFNASERIFVMSKGMQRFYEEKYKLTKFEPLVHSFEHYPDKEDLSGTPGVNKSHYKLVAIGNFNASNMDATIRFANAIKNNDKYSLHLYTHVPNILLKQRGLDTSLIHHEGFLNPDDVHQALQEYDICVLTHGFEGNYGSVEYKTIFPTRTIPLLLSGKPIMAHSPKGSFLNDFIEENQCAALVDTKDETEIVKALDRISTDLVYQNQLIQAASKTAHQFYGPNIVKKLKTTLALE